MTTIKELIESGRIEAAEAQREVDEAVAAREAKAAAIVEALDRYCGAAHNTGHRGRCRAELVRLIAEVLG